MKRILILAAVVVGLSVAGLTTSTANAGPWGPGYARCYNGYGYGYAGYVRPYPYRAYNYRVVTSPNLIISTPGIGVGFGTGYPYYSPYPVYNNYGFYGW